MRSECVSECVRSESECVRSVMSEYVSSVSV